MKNGEEFYSTFKTTSYQKTLKILDDKTGIIISIEIGHCVYD